MISGVTFDLILFLLSIIMSISGFCIYLKEKVLICFIAGCIGFYSALLNLGRLIVDALK